MTTNRREFLKVGALGSMAAGSLAALGDRPVQAQSAEAPIVISTWRHGVPANEAAWEVLQTSGRALNAVEEGVRVPEGDPQFRSVGYGGRPDREGHVTLDACIMDEESNCGSVAFLQHIKHPISVARRVMEETPHIMLVGQGALEFALAQGFEREDLLTEASEQEWREWLEEQPDEVQTEINIENHDTIGMLALDAEGNLSGACTTSGTAWKYHGRVGDSPLIGAGLFVDNEVGAACATGWGEAVIRTAGSHLVVESMRQGMTPQRACERAVERVIAKNPNYEDIQVAYLALDTRGNYGAYSVQSGFDYAVYDRDGGNRLNDAESRL